MRNRTLISTSTRDMLFLMREEASINDRAGYSIVNRVRCAISWTRISYSGWHPQLCERMLYVCPESSISNSCPPFEIQTRSNPVRPFKRLWGLVLLFAQLTDCSISKFRFRIEYSIAKWFVIRSVNYYCCHKEPNACCRDWFIDATGLRIANIVLTTWRVQCSTVLCEFIASKSDS